MNMTALLLAAAAPADGPVRDTASAIPAELSAKPGQGPKALIARPDSSLAAAAAVHSWREGAVYHLRTAPERVSDIALQPGETLIAVAAGDTARWVIGDTASGSGPARRTHILVKPAASGLRTNLVVTTDRRVYHLELSSGGKGMTGIAWTYPQDELLALRRAEATAPVAGQVAVERLNFNYAIAGDAPPWRPIRAFDDGAQVFIEFAAAIASTEAPPLFLVNTSGQLELVNYRKRGRYYVVDRLFEAAELRLGQKRQQVVRITRNDGSRQRRRGGRVS